VKHHNSLVRTRNTVFLYAILLFFLAVFALPTLVLFTGAFKVDEMQIIADLHSSRAFLPVGELGLLNFQQNIERVDIFHFFKNSVIITVISVTIGTLINSMLAFALARMKFKGRGLILRVIISLLIIPGEAIVIPQLLLVNSLGLIDTYLVQIIPGIADAFTIFLFYQAFLAIPRELEEAGIMDGITYPGIYSRIVMPLSKPVIVTTVILGALGKWGDVLWPTMVTRGAKVRPLAVGVNQLFSLSNKAWGDIFASAVIMITPILILYIIFQRQFIESLAKAGIKG
jgi:multiple sugar transport system permease protein